MTPIQVTTNTIKDLLDKNIIQLINPKTAENVTMDDPIAMNLINAMAMPLYDAIKGINEHRALVVPNATLPSATILTAPCPSLDIPWTEEKINEFSAVLDKYELDD